MSGPGAASSNYLMKLKTSMALCLCGLGVASCNQITQERHAESTGAHEHKTVQVNWREELNKTQSQLQRDPNSAFLHNQAAIAYDALGDFESFDREIHTAMTLDPRDPIHCYAAFAVYKRRHLADRSVSILDRALEIDPNNPFGHYEKAVIFENAKRWKNALTEYIATQELVRALKSDLSNLQRGEWTYLDARRNPYDVTELASRVDEDIIRVKSNIRKLE
jgi:tetratricopeptide (TPR) repeat protein